MHYSGLLFTESTLDTLFRSIVPIKITNMVCTGNESSLSECSYDGPDGDTSCTHGDDVVIRCASK